MKLQTPAPAAARKRLGNLPKWLWICVGGVALVYAVFVFPALPPVGDAADYAALIRKGEFGVRTVHIGYYVLAYPFAQLAQVVDLPLALCLNVLAALCMVAAVAIAFWIAKLLRLDDGAAACVMLALAFSGIFWYHAEFCELQALLMLMVFLSLALFLARRPVGSGIIFAAAMLTSQAAAPSALCFLYLAYRSRTWRSLALFAASFTFAFGVGVAPIARDYFFGPRGAFPSTQYYPAGSALKMVLYWAYRLAENFTVWLVAMAYGLVLAWRRARQVLAFAAVLWIGHAWVNLRLGHIEYGFAWMPAYLGASMLAGIGAVGVARRLWDNPKARVGVLAVWVVLSAVLSGWLYVWPKRADAEAFRLVAHQVRQRVGNATVIAAPHVGFVYVYETQPEVANVWRGTWVNVPSTAHDWRQLASRHGLLYLLSFRGRPHVFRVWLFNNRLARRYLEPEARKRFTEEEDDIVQQARDSLPENMALVRVGAWRPHTELWRVVAHNGQQPVAVTSEPRAGPLPAEADQQ
ncbi:MAG TPA: glycosyltransferase family 87 protein [Armatimonadota bacterium]|nr:glycosyltransferase family 87 protein [Armatimonadota bacterium]